MSYLLGFPVPSMLAFRSKLFKVLPFWGSHLLTLKYLFILNHFIATVLNRDSTRILDSGHNPSSCESACVCAPEILTIENTSYYYMEYRKLNGVSYQNYVHPFINICSYFVQIYVLLSKQYYTSHYKDFALKLFCLFCKTDEILGYLLFIEISVYVWYFTEVSSP